MNELTHRQLQVLALVADSHQRRGVPPTARELGKQLGIRSTNGVSEHLKALERKGVLRRLPRCARGLVLTEAGRRALGGAR
jgi:repressor LexA